MRSDAGPRRLQTHDLLARAQALDGAERTALLDEVILLNVPVAHSLARRYVRGMHQLEDLQQVACMALTRAVHHFDPRLSDDLLSYAVPTITGELKRHFRRTSWSIRPPRRVQELRPRVLEAEARLRQSLGRTPLPNEIADDLDCAVADVVEARDCRLMTAQTASLEYLAPDTGLSLSRLLADDGHRNLGPAEALVVLGPACRQLKERDRRILRMRFYDDMSQREIAQELGVTQVQVSRLLARIFRDLRRAIEPDGATG